MLWENLTAPKFKQAMEDTGLCILPVGVLEKHGNHLPLGTDMFAVREICIAAAEKEPAVVFPYYFMTQISEARHFHGTIAVSHRMMMDNLLAMCDEISRNGFKKILIANGHGGNNSFLPFFLQEMPKLGRDYCVYVCPGWNYTEEEMNQLKKDINIADMGSHAGVSETAMMMHLVPELVKLNQQDPTKSYPLGRLDSVKMRKLKTGFDWYADYPDHFAGDYTGATPELGKMIFDMAVENMIDSIKNIKSDDALSQLVKEYAGYGNNPCTTPKFYE